MSREFTHRVTEVTKKAPKSGFDQERIEHLVSQACLAIAPQSSTCHPGSSITIEDHFDGSLGEKQAHQGTRKEFSKGGRCTHIFYTDSLHQLLTGTT